MVEMIMGNELREQFHLQEIGEGWIQAIVDNQLERLEQFCQPEIFSRLLLPKVFVTYNNFADLLTKYREWYGKSTEMILQARRIEQVGEHLGIFYRLSFREDGIAKVVEQQLYCTLEKGLVAKLNMVCSGFQPVDLKLSNDMPPYDDLLEFFTESTSKESTCALLTPMIKAKLRSMQSGQVLEVRVNDLSAQGDIEAWSRLSGNPLLRMIHDESGNLRFFVQKK